MNKKIDIEKSLVDRVGRFLNEAHEIIKILFLDLENAEFDLIHLDDMNIHGSIIVDAFNFCNKDIELLKINIREKNLDMIRYLNQNQKNKVIYSGAHFINTFRWKINNERQTCKHYLKNKCTYGVFCKSNHPIKINKLCKNFELGKCIKGYKCFYKHNIIKIDEYKPKDWDMITQIMINEMELTE